MTEQEITDVVLTHFSTQYIDELATNSLRENPQIRLILLTDGVYWDIKEHVAVLHFDRLKELEATGNIKVAK